MNINSYPDRVSSKARVIFYGHASIMVYCMLCAELDATDTFSRWLIPNVTVFCVLFGSAFILPVVAAIAGRTSDGKIPLGLVSIHCAMSLLQIISAVEFFS